MQTLTLSDYMHHNRLKFLICVAPKSSIVSICDLCLGRISDKKLTNSCGYLDTLEEYNEIIVDKAFLLSEECAAKRIRLHISAGKRGKTQMDPSDLRKTLKIENLRILLNKIRRLKCFRIIANEMAINQLHYADDMLKLCVALSNL